MIILSNIKKLYDGSSSTTAAVQTDVDLCIEKGRVHSVGRHDAERRAGPDDTLVDCSTRTVTPGLIDCHGHITALGLSADAIAKTNSPAAFVYVEKILYETLVNGGVTSLRDVGGATDAMKRMVDEGVVIGPRLRISICMLSSTGGHADFRGPDRCHATMSALWPAAPGRPSSIVDGPWEARKRVREIAACGGDLIKLCTSPGVASPSDRLEHRDFTPKEIEAICEEAGARGMRVAAHAHSQSGIGLAIEHGVHDIQHISYMDERLVEQAHANNCTVTPTSWVIHALQEEEGLSDFVRDKAKQVGEVHARAVEHARSGGLKILMGTDAVLPGMHGRNFMELVHLHRDGLSELEAWHSSTGLAADEIGLDDTGVLKAGKRADLLICGVDVVGEPELLDSAGAIVEVMKDGEAYRGTIPELPQRTFEHTVRNLLGARP
ncbi:MAG: imidazolonepropionase-like amidohydrolase [Chlamydiales bacterium]|jgi:imidazolonepropionase-like amidohydrolase